MRLGRVDVRLYRLSTKLFATIESPAGEERHQSVPRGAAPAHPCSRIRSAIVRGVVDLFDRPGVHDRSATTFPAVSAVGHAAVRSGTDPDRVTSRALSRGSVGMPRTTLKFSSEHATAAESAASLFRPDRGRCRRGIATCPVRVGFVPPERRRGHIDRRLGDACCGSRAPGNTWF